MFKVEKDGQTMTIKNGNQLSAFLNNGWKEVSVKAETSKPTVVEEDGKHTRKEIMFMKTEDLQKLGDELGIDNASEKTAKELKTLICEKLGL